jgi:hypothetical protein
MPQRVALFNREDFAVYLLKKQFRSGAEIGVRQGDFSEILFKTIPGLKLYCIDPWSPYAETPSWRKQNRYFTETQKRLSLYNVSFLRMTSMEALKEIPDESLDFVYIDGVHDFENVNNDIRGWSSKVRSGGIVSGHDYTNEARWTKGVIPAVDAFVKEYNIELKITDEKIPSWFYLKGE